MEPSEAVSSPDGNATADLLVIGRFLAPHGIRGWIKFRSYTEDRVACFELSPWTIMSAQSMSEPVRKVDVLESRDQGEFFLLKLDGVDDRDQAQRLAGYEVFVPSAALPLLDDSEFYWRELIGMAVHSATGDSFGHVRDVIDNGAHDVLIVVSESRERLIPFLDPYLLSVDRSTRQILVDWNKDWD